MPQEIHTLPLSEACDLAGVIPTLKYIADWCAHEYQRATEQTSIAAGDADKFRYLAEQLRRVLTDVPDGGRRKFTVIRWQSDSDTIKWPRSWLFTLASCGVSASMC